MSYATPASPIELPITVHVEQAVYGSRRSVLQRGYHLIAKSPGITGDNITHLNRWCPSHGALLDEAVDASSLNFHPLGSDNYAISRTVYGEPEFSNRGGLQVVTSILVLGKDQLARYDNNPFAVARMARAEGLLRWSPAAIRILATVALRPAASEKMSHDDPGDAPNMTKALAAVRSGEPIVLTSSSVSPELLETLFLKVSPNERLGLSFTTGLKPSPQRPFRLHLLDEQAVRGLRLGSQNLPVLSIH